MARLGTGIRKRTVVRNGKREFRHLARVRIKHDGRLHALSNTFGDEGDAKLWIAQDTHRIKLGEAGEKRRGTVRLGVIWGVLITVGVEVLLFH
jgi:hypothetical protein